MGARADAKAKSLAEVTAAAHKLFMRHGYDAVRMRDVAVAANRSTGAIFSHFAGKAELFEAAMGHPAPDVQAFLARLVDNLRAGTGPAPLEVAEEADRLRRHLAGNHA